MACEHALSRFGQRGQNRFRGNARTSESRRHLFAEMLKTLLLWQKNEPIAQTQ